MIASHPSERRPMFAALACDYDGTLATDDRIAPATLGTLRRAHEQGIRLVLVTGRTLFDLLRICPDLECFDAVVAENGGVTYFPGDRSVRDEAPPPAPRLLAELDRRGVPFEVGRVIIATSQQFRGVVLDALATTDIRLELVSNRAALMLLPARVTKGSALRSVLAALGVRAEDTLAIGDAENDGSLFDVCGWAACPENAVAEIRARADWVFSGHDGDAVAEMIDRGVLAGTLPPPRSERHEVLLGWATASYEALGLLAEGANVLVHGDSLSGKSWLVGGLVERLAQRRESVCVIDPEGDYLGLRGLAGTRWCSLRDDADWVSIFEGFRSGAEATVIVDLTEVPKSRLAAIVGSGLAHLDKAREGYGTPRWVVLDEAHYYLGSSSVTQRLVGALFKGFCVVTYKASQMEPALAAAMDIVIAGRTTQAAEIRWVTQALGARGVPPPMTTDVLSTLPPGEFLLVRPGAPPVTFVPPARAFAHIRHRRKYAEKTAPPERCFLFRATDGRVVAMAASVSQFIRMLDAVSPSVLSAHATRGDFSRWVRDVLEDLELAAQLAKVERQVGRQPPVDLRAALRSALGQRSSRDLLRDSRVGTADREGPGSSQ